MAAAAKKGPRFLFRARPVSIALGAFIETPERFLKKFDYYFEGYSIMIMVGYSIMI